MAPYKEFFSITEVKEETGLTVATLRYWETRFHQLSPRKDAHGNRFYRQQEIDILKRIKYIRDELKITRIEAIQKELDKGERQTDVKQRATEILLRARKQLIDIRSQI